MAKSNRRDFLLLADKFRPEKHDPSGMYISEKLDGTRVFWDGGITRGMRTVDVPWASIYDPKKPGELKKKIKPVSTGLWSRYGNPVIAPDFWLNRLPAMPLDGELFAGRGNFQTLRSIAAKDKADKDAWHNVQFAVFGAPPIGQVFRSGQIKNTNFVREINDKQVIAFVAARAREQFGGEFIFSAAQTFEEEINLLQGALPQDDLVYLHQQVRLPADRTAAEKQMARFMDVVLQEGGEGIILRDPASLWVPKRAKTLLKLKPFFDDKGVVTGFVSGRETDKGSKLRGLIGALVLDYNGKRLELSGFTDEERKFENDELTAYAWNNPGEEMPTTTQGKYFKVGDTVEFRYREFSDDGVPKEARYLRQV